MGKLNDDIEALPDEQRVALKNRAVALKRAIYDQDPSFCRQPWDDELNSVCAASAWFEVVEQGTIHDGILLSRAEEILDIMSERYDILAMEATTEKGILIQREKEEDLSKLAGICRKLREEEVPLVIKEQQSEFKI